MDALTESFYQTLQKLNRKAPAMLRNKPEFVEELAQDFAAAVRQAIVEDRATRNRKRVA